METRGWFNGPNPDNLEEPFSEKCHFERFYRRKSLKNRRTFVKRNPLQQGERKKMSIAKGKKIC